MPRKECSVMDERMQFVPRRLASEAMAELRREFGMREVHDDVWLVSFMGYDLGYFDLQTRVLEPLVNPFGPKVLPGS